MISGTREMELSLETVVGGRAWAGEFRVACVVVGQSSSCAGFRLLPEWFRTMSRTATLNPSP